MLSNDARSAEFNTEQFYSSIAQSYPKKSSQVIISTGYGTDSSSALRNAAENALKSIVGSYINSQTLIQKQSVIANGIASYVKKVDVRSLDYSQGSISSIKILSTKQENSLFVVTARVAVKPETFKAFILELASDTAKVESSLFAQIAVDNQNQENRLEMIDDLLKPISRGEAVDVKSETPIRLKDFTDRSNYNFLRSYDESSTIIIPFEISLKDSFKQNLYNSLDGISSSKKFYYGGSFDKYSPLRSTTQDLYIGISDEQSGERIVYGFKGLAPLLKARKEWHPLKLYQACPLSCGNSYHESIRSYYSPLTIKVVDADNQTISSISMSEYKNNLYSSPRELTIQCVPQTMYNGTRTTPCEILAFSLSNRGGSESIIYPSKKFFLVLNMNVEKLSKVSEVRIGYGQL